MRVFAIPAAYAELLEGEVARLVDDIRRDAYRREHGETPVFPDMLITPDRKGSAFAVVGQASDNLVAGVAQAKKKARAELRSA